MGSSRISTGNHTQFSFDLARWENQSISATITLILSNNYAEQLIPLKYFVIQLFLNYCSTDKCDDREFQALSEYIITFF